VFPVVEPDWRIHKKMNTKVALLLALAFFAAPDIRQAPTELFLRGYSVLPTPQKVELHGADVEFDETWSYDARTLPADHIAVRSLLRDLKDFHLIELKPGGSGAKKVIRLAVSQDTVKTGSDPELKKQGYRLKLEPDSIEITGNADAGLFYGVQTVLQLIRTGPRNRLLFPVATIEDWPALQLRFLHWDTKHHQDRIETLKRYLDWSARFKINMIGFELEDKFEYPTNPVIGAPGAFTSAEMQEIVNYGLERFIQVVPQIQAPAHLGYALKHPQFAHLRADGNNYQACLCDDESYRLIFQMYDDVIKATKGVDYLFVSTDEVYYAGICGKCGQPYNAENRSLKWVEFVRRARDFAASRGRRILVWAEYPLLPEHVKMLPPDIIDGVIGEESYLKTENELGIRQLAYTSMQGEELLFPNYLPGAASDEKNQDPDGGRLNSAYETISFGRARRGKAIGVFGAAWGDAGLHNETFWLGWATVAEYGWLPGRTSVEQTVAEFMNIYYGPRVSEMVEVYRGLQSQTRFFEKSWDRVISKVRAEGYGNSYGKGIGTKRYDQTLPQPAVPELPTLNFTPVYTGRYQRLVAEAQARAGENDALVHRLYQNMGKADRNRYNLEVFLSIAGMTGHQIRLILGMKEIEEELKAAREAAEKSDAKRAANRLIAAYTRARELTVERQQTYERLKAIWEKSRFPKNREVDGKKFYHVFDDVKDHWADRRVDLSYIVAPEESIRLEEWMNRLGEVIREYAKKNDIPVSMPEEAKLGN
jgi:hexosaminidase